MSTINKLVSMTAAVSIGAAISACSSGTPSATTSGAGGAATTTLAAPSFVAHFDPTKGELPEGLFVDQGAAYVGYAPLGKLVKIDLPGGTVHDFGAIPPIPMNGGYMLGIVVDAAGSLFVGFGAGMGSAPPNGVYELPAAGGSVTKPFATHPDMNFPNGLVFDASGKLFVADSGGAIFAITPDGTATKWSSDPALSGTDLSCKHAAPFPLGANGIVQLGGAFYVTNTNLGSIVKIPINGDGSAGAVSVIAGPDCELLGGVDGIAVDADGASLLAVSNSQSKLLRIDTEGKVTTLLSGMPFDNPASISVAKVGSTTSAYVTNSSFFDMKTPSPGLLEVVLQ
jgi:sugar lactone lactonase YvrE